MPSSEGSNAKQLQTPIHTGFHYFTKNGQNFRITRKSPKRYLRNEKKKKSKIFLKGACPCSPLEGTYFENQSPFFPDPRLSSFYVKCRGRMRQPQIITGSREGAGREETNGTLVSERLVKSSRTSRK